MSFRASRSGITSAATRSERPAEIFATVWHKTNSVNLRLTVEQQQRFLLIDGEGFVEIDNAWGRQGWTTANLEYLEREQFFEALKTAWENSASKIKKKAGRTKPKPKPKNSKR